MSPEAYLRCCRRLFRRGLSHRLYLDLREAGDVSLLRDLEVLTDRQLAALNTADRQRRPA